MTAAPGLPIARAPTPSTSSMPTAVDMASGMTRPIASEKRVSRSVGTAAAVETEDISEARIGVLSREVQRFVLRLEVDVPVPDLPAALELQRQNALRRARNRIVV